MGYLVTGQQDHGGAGDSTGARTQMLFRVVSPNASRPAVSRAQTTRQHPLAGQREEDKEDNEMPSDTTALNGVTMDEFLDHAKFPYLEGMGHLQAAADRISVLAFDGATVSGADLELLHDLLRIAADDLSSVYVRLCELATGGIVDDFTYSDGSRAFTVVPSRDHRDGGPVYCGDIWYPDIPASQKVRIVPPPHPRGGL